MVARLLDCFGWLLGLLLECFGWLLGYCFVLSGCKVIRLLGYN